MAFTWLWIIIAVVVIVIIARNIRIVPQAYCFIVERLGQYQKTWQAGLHVKMPFIDSVSKKISLKEHVFDFPPQPVITKDNVTMTIDSVVYAYVFDAKKYTYGVENPDVALQNLAATTLRSVIGAMELDATLSSRAEINAQMQSILDRATDEWGIKVTRVEIKNITPPPEIEEVMTKQMRAERERRQTVLEAQAHQEAVVSRAEGDKQAKILAAEAERDAQIALAEGRALAIEKVYAAEAEGIQKLAQANLTPNILKLKAIESLKDVADGQATKIFIPSDMAETFSQAAVFGDMLHGSGPQKTVPRREMRRMQTEVQARHAVAEDTCLTPETSPLSKDAALSNARTQQTLNNKTLR